jgi:formamidopyrimidine-DNA glycosylase
LPTPEVEQLDFFRKVGPEPLAADFTAKDFTGRLQRRHKSGIKSVLLDQTVIAGVGNIYADECLWGAKIHPLASVQDLGPAKLRKLYEVLRAVLALAIEKGGSTDRNYVNHEGKRGSYLNFAHVFRREGQPCPRCGTPIIKTKAAGRGTHICPKCQRSPSVVS